MSLSQIFMITVKSNTSKTEKLNSYKTPTTKDYPKTMNFFIQKQPPEVFCKKRCS